jgi:hypothetical protein
VVHRQLGSPTTYDYRSCCHGYLNDAHWRHHGDSRYFNGLLLLRSTTLNRGIGNPVYDALTQKTNFDFSAHPAASHTAIAFVYIYVMSFALTWACVAWVYPPEIFAMNMRGRGTSMTSATNWFVVSNTKNNSSYPISLLKSVAELLVRLIHP